MLGGASHPSTPWDQDLVPTQDLLSGYLADASWEGGGVPCTALRRLRVDFWVGYPLRIRMPHLHQVAQPLGSFSR